MCHPEPSRAPAVSGRKGIVADGGEGSAFLFGLAVDRPNPPAFADELDLVIRVAVRTRSRAGLSPRTRITMEQEHRNTGVALLRSAVARGKRALNNVANYQQMANSPGARDASLAALLPGLDESCHHLVTRRKAKTQGEDIIICPWLPPLHPVAKYEKI